MLAMILALSTASEPAQASTFQFCTSTWDDLIQDSADPSYLFGSAYPVEGGKGTIFGNDLEFRVYQNGLGEVGSFEVSVGGSLSVFGNVTNATPLIYTQDCNDPYAGLHRYLIEAETTTTPGGFYIGIR